MSNRTAVSPLPEHTSRSAGWVVWGTWGILSVAGLWFAWHYALDVPFADEWHWVSIAGRQTPVTWEWIFAQHNEHRPLVSRLIYLGLARLTNYDLRAGGVFDTAMLSLLAALAIGAARAVRGRTSVGDAFFPLTLLNWSQFTNLLWGFQICLVMAAMLIGAGMLAITQAGRGHWLRWAMATVACFLAATWSAAAGLAYLPGLAVWLCAGAAVCWRRKNTGYVGQCLGTLLLAAITMAALAVYFVGFHRPSQHLVPDGMLAVARTVSETLANTLGALGKKLWPVSSIIVILGCLVSLVHLLGRFWRHPSDRLHVVGLLGFLAGCLGLALGIGWGRAFLGPGGGAEDRYVTLALPLGCLFYWQSVVLPGRWATRLQIGLMLVAAVIWTPNAIKGLRGAASLQGYIGWLRNDARQGVPIDALAVRYLEGSGFSSPRDLARPLDVLWRHGWGPYRGAAQFAQRRELEIRPFVQPMPDGPPIRHAALPSGGTLVSRLQGSGSLRIERIDLQTGRSPRRAPQRLRWELATPDGALLASGVNDTAELSHTDWISLRMQGVVVRGEWRLELRLSAEGEAHARPLEIPQFGPGETLKGFFYCTPLRPL